MWSNEKLVEFIKRYKGYDELQALKAAYQTRLFIRSLIYTVIIGTIIALLGYAKEVVLVFVCYKSFRQSAGGIHVKGIIKCFVLSFITIFGTILLDKYVHLTVYVEIILWIYSIFIWYLLVPQGTSQRPIRKEDEKRKMKIATAVLMVVVALIRVFNYEIYKLSLWSMVITLSFVTPIAYKVFKVKHDRL